MYKLQQSGWNVNAMKPVAAGTTDYPQGRLNEDAVQLRRQCSLEPDYDVLNPYLFDEPIAPHIAAARQQRDIQMDVIADAFQQLRHQAEVTLVEGAGGWLVPLNAQQDIADIAVQLDLPVIVVVGLKLGCINHARLTLQAVAAKGCRLAGWIATQVDPDMLSLNENVAALKHYLDAPCLGIVPFTPDPAISIIAQYLEAESLLSDYNLDAEER